MTAYVSDIFNNSFAFVSGFCLCISNECKLSSLFRIMVKWGPFYFDEHNTRVVNSVPLSTRLVRRMLHLVSFLVRTVKGLCNGIYETQTLSTFLSGEKKISDGVDSPQVVLFDG